MFSWLPLEPYARLHREHRRAPRRRDHHQGMAAQSPVERQDPLSHPAGWLRLPPGGDVEGGGRRRHVQGRRPSVAGNIRHRHRHGEGRCTRAGRIRDRRQDARRHRRLARLSDHAQGARRRLPARPPPPVDPQRAPAGDSARPARDHQRHPRLLQLARLHPGRHADFHARGLRRHHHAVPGAVLRDRRHT